MPLSEYEQRVLEQMERELTSDDPRLATTLNKTTANRSGVRYVIAGLGLVVGLLALIVGVAESVPWVGVVGFIIMFSAVAYAFAQPSKSKEGPTGVVTDAGTVKPRGSGGSAAPTKRRKKRSGGKQANRGSFMQRLEDRWDKRGRGE